MQIVLIILLAAMLSPGLLAERAIYKPLTSHTASLVAAAIMTLGVPVLVGLASWLCVRRLQRPGGFARATTLFGRVHTGMRFGLLTAFALLTTQTGWLYVIAGWRPFGLHLARIPLAGELAVIAPVLAGCILCWLVMYPADRALRQAATAGLPEELTGEPIWGLGQYLDFQVRYQILTVLVPMGLFIIAVDLASDYRSRLIEWTQVMWAPEATLAITAAAIFVLSPVMLMFVWRTEKLPASPLRSQLEATCRRIGMKYRDILIWRSHGAMVNAAVMGILPHIRYVLLSDGLLDHLSQKQVEAVFGHEAGHVKEHHIAYYMVFAIGSMMAVSLAAEYLTRQMRMGTDSVQFAVAGMVAFIWLAIFGWISRRFERQADLHGVRCLDGTIEQCLLPCWRHNIPPEPAGGERMCTTGAQVFSSALEAVAALNGISKFSRSWRHSSIASRQEFVRQAAFHPQTLRRFERTVSRVKATLVGATLVLAVVAAWFYWPILFPQQYEQKIEYVRDPPMWVQRPDTTHSPSTKAKSPELCLMGVTGRLPASAKS